MAGRVLGGRYTVQDRIGTGGMATVYRGVDEVLGRTVAIKTMLPQYASDESFAARFKQEAQAAAALQSPYIVQVYDWGKDGNTYYIVMEYLRGIDLKSGIRRHGALDPQKVAQIGSQIAKALSVAHKHDIIHRDIKPQNIMVQQDGNIKVMDFGIARAKNSHITTDNSVLGTAHYVSPEQTQGKELGPTTDIYSLGIVMYEASTGRVPFDGDDAISVALKQVNEQPLPPSQINPAVDPSLESIILKCMQKDPADRFQTADELGHVLMDYLAGRIQAVNAATSGLNITATQVAPVVDTHTDSGVIPSVDRVSSSAERSRPLTATEHALREQKRKERSRRRKTIFGIVLALLAITAAAYAAMQMYAAGNATRAVPNLLNYTQEEALLAIQDTDFFEAGNVREEYSTTVERGKVMDQDPDPQRQMARGTQINIWVSKGPEPAKSATVPDLTGMTPAEAEEALEAANLVGRAGDSVYDSNVEVGLVVKQSPVANTTVKEGDAVIYNLSKGIESVEVPNVVGSSYYDAESALTERGFQIDVGYESSDEYAEGYVIRQSPTSMADKGTYVTVIVSTGPQLVEVPWVEGYSESVARSMLEDYGFTVNVSHVESREVESGLVIGQDVSGSAQSGATVSIEVSTGPGPSYDGGNPDDQGQGTDQGEGTNTPTTTPAEDTATEGEVTPEG